MTLQPITVEEELRRSFELATLRRQAKGIETPRQWCEAAQLQARCRSARVREKELYAVRYATRVETARQRLIDEAGRKGSDFKPGWAADDRFSPAATLRQAQRDVRHAHERRIGRVDEFERQQLAVLVERSRRENEVQGMARDDFNRVTDRRMGVERRRVRLRPREH